MTFKINLPKRLALTIKLLLWLSLFTALAGCGQVVASTPLPPTAEPSPTAGSLNSPNDAAPTSAPPTAEAEALTSTAAPTAEAAPNLEASRTAEPAATSDPATPGALIQVSMESQVGVLLDGMPADIRDAIAEEILQRPEAFWLELARQQVRLTRNRLNFRDYVYAGKGQLPLPPEALWSITVDPAGPRRQTIQGHDLLLVDYAFESTLLSDRASPGQAEPALAEVGGVWQEPFVFPVDPTLILQRTENACINEGGFPAHSFDSENVWIFYDYTCEADSGGAAGCHRTRLPRLSCREALQERVGEVETAMRFERLDWDSELADEVRVERIANVAAADLQVVSEDLETNRIVYRYIEPDDCALLEGAVGASGWRRLLQFSATVANVGPVPLDIGPVVAEDPVNHIYSYNACHDHFHYNNYGEFILEGAGEAVNSKQAFCVQSTSRFSNNETTPLVHDYSCSVQGIEAGWVDEYVAGLDTQWIDITEMAIPEEGATAALTFVANSQQFLCEGTPVVDENGDPVWEASGTTTAEGESINRPACEFIADWDANNRAREEVFVPQRGSFVSEPCENGAFSPLRNCGFVELLEDDLSCAPGERLERAFRLEDGAGLQVVRVCERSEALGSGVACTFQDSLVNVMVSAERTPVAFICPQVRDSPEGEGGYALYMAPVWPLDAQPAVVSVVTGGN